MSYLVDATVLSEATRSDPDPRVLDWLKHNGGDVVLDPIVLGEIRFGILLLPAGNRRSSLEQWFDEGVHGFPCIPFDAITGMRWAKLLADLRARGESVPIKYSWIAASAIVHRLTVVTRNVSDFEKTGVEVLNPFA